MHPRHTVLPAHKKGSNHLATPAELILDYTLLMRSVSNQPNSINLTKINKYFVCDVELLKSRRSIGWEMERHETVFKYLLVYKDNSVFSYLNCCPHTGVNLDWVPDQFLDTENIYIQCSTHGALFKVENGECIHGPCLGDHLKKADNIIENGKIYLLLHE